MNRLALSALALFLSGSSLAWSSEKPAVTPTPQPSAPGEFRVGGETIADAVSISSTPFHDDGTTCGHLNDYDEVCPYTGSLSPDVVYEYYCYGYSRLLSLELCASQYDTKIYVYRAPDFTDPIACSDDAGCGYTGYQSRIEYACLDLGATYYFVVDGYGSACGTYSLNVDEYLGGVPCYLECPPGGIYEGEGPCYDEYVDHHNGGCSSDPPVFEVLSEQSNGCAAVCGQGCAHTIGGQPGRDEDWFEVIASGAVQLTAELRPGFVAELKVATGDCPSLNLVDYTYIGECSSGSVAVSAYPGQRFFIGVMISGWNCPPGGTYVLNVCGLGSSSTSGLSEPSPSARAQSWGRIKSIYRK